MRCYLFDVDGTLSDLSHRLHYIKPEYDAAGMLPAKDWEAFFAACADDAPIAHMVELAVQLSFSFPVVFVSGRSDECRKLTEEWLDKHCGSPLIDQNNRLYMRTAGDHRPDHIVKAELLDRILADGYQPIMAFEDRDQVVKMWRERGVPCAQVAEGNF